MVSHVRVSFQPGHFDLLYSQKLVKPFFCIHGFKNYIVASDLVHTFIASVMTPSHFRHGCAFFGPLADKNIGPLADKTTREAGISTAPSQQKVFRTLCVHDLQNQFETLYIHLVGSATLQVRVSLQSDNSDLHFSQKCATEIFFI